MSQSQGTQLSVTKKSNVLDKPKANILNSGTKNTPNNNTTNNNNNNNNNNNSSADSNDSGSRPQQQAHMLPVPEVTVSIN